MSLDELTIRARWQTFAATGPSLVFELWLNGEQLADGRATVADVGALRRGLETPGEYALTVCLEEDSDCRSVVADVTHQGHAIVWDHDRCRFDRTAYQAAIDAAISAGQAYLAAYTGPLVAKTNRALRLPFVVLRSNEALLRPAE